jgi:hypothetical protein
MFIRAGACQIAPGMSGHIFKLAFIVCSVISVIPTHGPCLFSRHAVIKGFVLGSALVFGGGVIGIALIVKGMGAKEVDLTWILLNFLLP